MLMPRARRAAHTFMPMRRAVAIANLGECRVLLRGVVMSVAGGMMRLVPRKRLAGARSAVYRTSRCAVRRHRGAAAMGDAAVGWGRAVLRGRGQSVLQGREE